MRHSYKSFSVTALALSMVAPGYLPARAQDSADVIPIPLPASAKSNRLDAGVGLVPAGQGQELKTLSSLATTGIEVSARTACTSFKGLLALRLSVKNNTDRPLTFNGNQTVATIGDVQLRAASMSELSDRIKQPDNPRGYLQRSMENTVTAALALGALQAVEGERVRRGPIADRYGFDNLNRIDRLGRFAERILWPGDASEGIVYFKTNKSLAGASLQVPVSDFYDRSDNTTARASVK